MCAIEKYEKYQIREISNHLTKVQQEYASSQQSHNTEATEMINDISTDDWTNDESDV